jgi:hypothetical protein
MGIDAEVFRLQVLSGIVEGVIIEQNSPKNGAFRLNIRGHATDAGFESCHDV